MLNVLNADLKLSVRQLQILRGVAKGRTNIAIGFELGITKETVRGYLKLLYRQLFSKCDRIPGRNLRLEAVLFALRSGQMNWWEI